MAKKHSGRGFKASKNYEPGRGKSSNRSPRGSHSRSFEDRDDSRRFNDRDGYESRRGERRDHRGHRDHGEYGERSEFRERGDYRERSNHRERGDYRERSDYRGRGEHRDRMERGERGDRFERSSHRDRHGRPERQERFDRVERDGRDRYRGRAERNDRFDRGNRFDRADRFEQGGRYEGQGRHHRGGKPNRKERFFWDEDVVLDRIKAIKTSADDVADLSFRDLGLGSNIIETLEGQGATRPFPIQAATIPDVLKGNNVLGRARTGSGKTIAFGAALVERLLQLKAEGKFAGDPPKVNPNYRRPRRERAQARKPKVLILAPTRELALQIDRTVQPIARSVGFYTIQIYGGVPQAKQVTSLNMGVDIVIGTPGRMEDLIRQGHLDLREIEITVLDEADHMCDLGFLEPVQRLLRHTPRDGQRLLFSATLDAGVAELVIEFLPKHVAHEVTEEDQASGTIDHQVLVVNREDKRDVLSQLARTPGKVLVFTRTRAFAEELTDRFNEEGTPAVALHGDLNQAKRSRNLAKMENGKARVLVATDVAARGIHVDDIDLVVQADASDEYKTYLHRAGRTGRAGSEGTVVTVISHKAQRRTKEMLQRAQIVPSFFASFKPGDDFPPVS